MSTLKRIALTLLAVALPCFAWGEVVYTNTLAGRETLTVDEVEYKATAFTELTTLTEDDTNKFDTVIYKDGGDNDTRTHTFSMWVKVPTLTDDQILWWVCGGHNGDHGGYAVKAMADGKIRVGKANANGAWNGTNYVTSSDVCLEANTWAYVTVVVTKTADARTATPAVYVNGGAKTISGTFPTNLNGNGGSDTYAQIGSGILAAGVKVDNTALDATSVAQLYAFSYFDLTPVLAETPTWVGTAETASWDDGANWEGGSAPTAGDSVIFNLTNPLTLTVPAAGVTVDTITVSGAKLTLTGGKVNAATVDISSELETPVNLIEAATFELDTEATLTLDAGSTEVGRTTKIRGGTVVKKGSGLLNLFQPAAGVDNAILADTTVQIIEGVLKLNIGSNQDPWIKDTTFNFANGTALQQYGWCHGSGTITLNADDGVEASAFESNLTESCTLTKTGAGKVTVAISNFGGAVQVNGGTLTHKGGTLSGTITTAADTTLEFIGTATINNANNRIVGLLKVSSGTVTHNGADRGLNSIEVAEGATLQSSAADGLNYNGTTTATINGTLHLKNRWTIFAANTFYVSGTLASDDNNFGNFYGAYDFYNHADNDNNHSKLYVTGPNAQITGRWGAHDSSKTLDVVFDTDDAKLTITKAPSAHQHVTTMLDDGVTSGAIAINTSVTTEKLLTIAGGVSLSGTGSWGGPLTFADGAILDATAGALTVTGTVTKLGALTIDATGRAAGAAVLNCTNAADIVDGITLTAADGLVLKATDAGLVLAVPYTGEFEVSDAAGITDAIAAITEAKADATITLTTNITVAETLVIDAGAGNTVTIELNDCMILSDAPVIRIQSGTLKLVAGSGATSAVTSSSATAIVVGADDNAGTTVADEACALDIGAGVNVSTNDEIAVNLVKGSISGAGSIYGGLNLENGTTVDATNGHLTITGDGDTARIHFPEPISDGMGGTMKSMVTFLMPDGLVYPQEIIKCTYASADHAEDVTINVNDFLHNNYALTVMLDNQTGAITAYGLSQYVCSADSRNYTSVAEAIRAGEEEITLRANVKEDIVVPSGVKLDLYSTATLASYTVVGNVTIESGAILEPRGGDIEGNLILKDGATLSVYSEVQNPASYDFHVSGTVTFPTGTITVIAEDEGTTVALGEPQQIISSGVALTPGATLEGTTVNVVSAAGQAASEDVKVISTSYTYEIVSVDSGNCTLDGVEYETIQHALAAYTATGDATLKLKSAPTLTETLVIDVDDPTTDEIEEITIDLNGYALDATLDNEAPTIRIESGDVWLISTAADNTYTQVSSTNATAIVVGADETGVATEKAALHIDDSVTVMAATYAVDVVSGTLSGDATLAGNLNLRDGAIVDASASALTMYSYLGTAVYTVTFPGTEAARGTITVIPPVGATQATFVNQSGAPAAAHQYTDVLVVLTETAVSADYEIIETYETVDETQVATGYAVWAGEHVAATITSTGIEYHATFAAAVDAAGSTGTIILMSDITLETDVAADIYTNGFDITTANARTINGKLTITDGTVITLADALTVEEVELVEYADASVAGTITSTGNVTIKGTLSGMYTINGNVVLTDGAGLAGYASVTSVAVSEGATVTIDATVNTNLTVNNATVNGTGTIEIGEDKTLAGAGTINTTVILDDGATVDTCGYESNFLVLTALNDLTEDILITVKADTLSNVINAGTAAIATSNFTLTLADGSTYEAYNPGTPQALDTAAELLIPVVATRNGENLLGVVKLNYYIGGVQIADPTSDAGVGVAKSLAAYGYRNGILEIKGVDTASSDPVEGYQLFTNVVNGFVGDYLVITYKFGITDITVMNLTKDEVPADYIVVTADVDGVYDKTEGDLSGNADFRTGTTVVLTDAEGTAVEGAVEIKGTNAGDYGLEYTAQPGVKVFVVPLTAAPADGSESLKFKVKATNE